MASFAAVNAGTEASVSHFQKAAGAQSMLLAVCYGRRFEPTNATQTELMGACFTLEVHLNYSLAPKTCRQGTQLQAARLMFYAS